MNCPFPPYSRLSTFPSPVLLNGARGLWDPEVKLILPGDFRPSRGDFLLALTPLCRAPSKEFRFALTPNGLNRRFFTRYPLTSPQAPLRLDLSSPRSSQLLVFPLFPLLADDALAYPGHPVL